MKKKFYIFAISFLCFGIIASLITGRFTIDPKKFLLGDQLTLQVFWTLRVPRTLMALFAGFGLSVAGYIYQTIFKNPIASPDIIGVSSGACAGAAVSIVVLGSTSLLSTALMSFVGGLLAVLLSILLSIMSKEDKIATFVLAGICVNAVSQTVLMIVKTVADPENELAALEFWTMGSLAGITLSKVLVVLPITIISLCTLFIFYRHISLLSLDSDQAKMLGIKVIKTRALILILTTLAVGSIVSVTGLISFVGLIAPHLTRLITKTHNKKTMLYSGIMGSSILLCSDTLVRCISTNEIPISVLTSCIGVPMLLFLIIKGGKVQ